MMKYTITELTRKRRTKPQKPWGQDMDEVMNFVASLASMYPKGKPIPKGVDPGSVLERKSKKS
jgi:hypothetical protein